MKQKLLYSVKLRAIMLVAILCAVFTGTAWAADVETTYTFSSKAWAASPANWSGTKDGNQFNSTGTPKGVQVCTGQSGVVVTSPKSFTKVKQVVVTYSSSSKGVGSIEVKVGSTSLGSQSISKSQTETTLTYSASNLDGSVSITCTCTTNSMGINSVKIVEADSSTPITYTVTYDGNEATSGTAPTDATAYSSGATVTVLGNTGSLVKTGYTFDGWNTKADGSGTDRAVGSTFSISANTTLYAKWTDSRTATTVVIDDSGIGNTNKYVSTDAGSFAAIVNDNNSEAIDGAAVTWTSSEVSVATINSTTGAVTLVGAGTTTITASYAGNATYQPSSETYELTVTNENPAFTTIWSEDFSSYAANAVPSGGTYGYSCENGGTYTKIYTANLAGGTSPELLISNNGGSFTATIPLLTSTYGYSGDLELTFRTNNTNIAVSTTTDGVTVSGSIVSGVNTITLEDVTTDMENIVIKFTNSESSNVRIDNIVLKGEKVALSKVTTPAISPAGGAVVSGTEVTMTCLTDDATIYYTTDGSTPTSSSTAYNPASKPTITSGCTIKAIGIKDGLTDSDVASATYTIAEPCATPTFTVAEGEVAKGTTVEIECGTADATIYYTTDGSTPTTSSTLYSSALTINSAQTIKAIAVKDGLANSAVASATYTVIDYATLPFVFDAGKNDLTTGLTHSGLGSDYDNSPKLKFDGSGDYLVLKTNAAIQYLIFDIKGNSFSGGTFKIQTSTNGVDYSDLKTYSSLTNTVDVELFTTIASDVRYIKWNYVTKSSGNVALGNIRVNCESATVTAAGYATFVSPVAVNFTGDIKAYIAKVKGDKSGVTFEQVTKVPANTGVLLYKDGGAASEQLTILTGDPDDVTGNVFVKGTGSAVESEDGTLRNYILNKPSEKPIGFYKANKQTVAKNRAYIQIDVSAGVKEFIALPGSEETAVEAVKANAENGVIINLAGQRIHKLQRGINIVNGRKVVVK